MTIFVNIYGILSILYLIHLHKFIPTLTLKTTYNTLQYQKTAKKEEPEMERKRWKEAVKR